MEETNTLPKCRYCGGPMNRINKYMIRCSECTVTEFFSDNYRKEIYISPIKLSKSLALDSLLLWLEKNLGSPPSMFFDATITWSRLLLLPYYNSVIRIKGISDCTIKKAYFTGRVLSLSGILVGEEAYKNVYFDEKEISKEFDRITYISIPLFNEYQLQDKKIKQLFTYIDEDIKLIKIPFENKAIYKWIDVSDFNPYEIPINLKKEKIYSLIESNALRKIRNYISKNCIEIMNISYNKEITENYPIYLPIWLFKYKLRNQKKEYIGIVEASTGRVLYASYPVKKTIKYGIYGLGILHLLGAIITYITIGPLGISISIPLALYGATYTYRGYMMGRAREV